MAWGDGDLADAVKRTGDRGGAWNSEASHRRYLSRGKPHYRFWIPAPDLVRAVSRRLSAGPVVTP